MRSLMTCWRLAFLCEIASSLLRCWMSYSVMGEPFAMTTTCAGAVPGMARARPTTAPMSHRPYAERLTFIGRILDSSMFIACAVCGLILRAVANALAHRRAAQRAQTQLQHDCMVRLHISAICIVRKVVQTQYQAIVDIAETHASLVELSGIDVIAGATEQDPICIELDLSGSQNTLLTIQDADQRLRGVIAVENTATPSVEISPRLEFNPLRRETFVAQTEARSEHVDAVWLIREPRHVVGVCGVKAAVKSGIGRARDGKGILPKQTIGLTEQGVDGASLVELGSVLKTIVCSSAAFGAIPAREFVDTEQVAVVKDQALRILVLPLSDLRLVRPQEHLRDRLQGLRTPGLNADERIAILQAGRRHAAHETVVRDGREV